jgi:hypothetical protein
VNAIADTVIHAQIYKYLIDLHEILVRIRANQAGYFFLNFTLEVISLFSSVIN